MPLKKERLKQKREMEKLMSKISFVIPCYGSEHTLKDVVNEIENTVEEENQKCKRWDYEIILVNDYSPDNVWNVIENLCECNSRIKGIKLAKNFGQHSALMAGYNCSTGDYVITLDDDGQTPANQAFRLINKLEEGYDVVYGYYPERKDNGCRKMGTALNNFMSEKIIGKPKDVHLTSYFVARKLVIDEIIKYRNPYPYIWGLVVRTTKNIANVEIDHKARKDGASGYTLGKLINLWLNGFTAFSVKPLRIASIVGMGSAVLGAFLLIYTIVMKFVDPNMVAGYTSLMSVILFVCGMIMIMLGLIGEYVGRIYICLNESPQFVIRETLNVEKN